MNLYRATVYAGEELRRGQRCWYFQIRDSQGRLMAKDNTGSWRVVYDEAVRTLEALRNLEIRGFDLEQPEWLKERDI